MNSKETKNLLVCLIATMLFTGISFGQNEVKPLTAAGNWMASCEGNKLKFDDGYEISLITIETGAEDPGQLSAEFYYAVDYVANGETAEFECANQPQHWEDWAIDLYFSFSFTGNYSNKQLTLEVGEEHSFQTDYQLKPEFAKMKISYECVDTDQLVLVIQGKSYSFYRMTDDR